MKKVKELQSGGLYAIQINSSANSALVEKVYHAKKFLKLVNSRLDGFVKIYDYLISNDSVFLVLKIADSDSIQQKYIKIRENSSKANRALDHNDIWKIISEQFRHLISMYVKWFNRDTGRSGSMVKKNYDRFYFETVDEAKVYLEKMKQESIQRNQREKKYRPSKRVNSLIRRMKKGMIYLCGLHKELQVFRDELKRGSVSFKEVKEEVLRKLITKTLRQHEVRNATKLLI